VAPPPPPPPPVAPPPPAAETAPFALDALKAQASARITLDEIDQVAQRLGVETAAIRAVVQVESAGSGFAADGRPLILFEPVLFHEETGGRFDATHPHLSQAEPRPGALGRTQAERWAKLAEAFALDPDAALKATSWGLFQLSGREHVAAGYGSVYALAADIARSERQQLLAFEKVVRSKELSDELRALDWDAFSRIYNGQSGAEKYGRLLSDAYQAIKRTIPASTFIDSLVAKTPGPLTPRDVAECAERLGVERAAVQAVLKVESRGSGFAADGRPIILYEPHVFSRITQRRFDATHPELSYVRWKDRPYPKTQADRWKQLARAHALDAEAAVGATSWGLFQILGLNHKKCGFDKATTFVAHMAQSEAAQLQSFEAFVRSSGLVDELQNKDWAGFARIYNGPGQVELYGRLLSEAYAQFAATS
jgi:hypothetical protein